MNIHNICQQMSKYRESAARTNFNTKDLKGSQRPCTYVLYML